MDWIGFRQLQLPVLLLGAFNYYESEGTIIGPDESKSRPEHKAPIVYLWMKGDLAEIAVSV